MLGVRLSAGSIGRRTYRRIVSPCFFAEFHVGTYLLGISLQEIILISATYMVLEISCVRIFGFLHYSGWSRVDLLAQPGRSISWLPPPQSSPSGAVVHVRLI